MSFRCPVHDKVFDPNVSNLPPGHAKLREKFGEGHPDCELCQRTVEGVKKISRAQVQEAATKAGVSFDTAAQQAVAQGFELEAA